MHAIRALLCLGLFGTLGYAVWTGQLTGGSSSKSRALGDIVDMATSRYGVEGTSVILVGVGVILAFVFLIIGARQARAANV